MNVIFILSFCIVFTTGTRTSTTLSGFPTHIFDKTGSNRSENLQQRYSNNVTQISQDISNLKWRPPKLLNRTSRAAVKKMDSKLFELIKILPSGVLANNTKKRPGRMKKSISAIANADSDVSEAMIAPPSIVLAPPPNRQMPFRILQQMRPIQPTINEDNIRVIPEDDLIDYDGLELVPKQKPPNDQELGPRPGLEGMAGIDTVLEDYEDLKLPGVNTDEEVDGGQKEYEDYFPLLYPHRRSKKNVQVVYINPDRHGHHGWPGPHGWGQHGWGWPEEEEEKTVIYVVGKKPGAPSTRERGSPVIVHLHGDGDGRYPPGRGYLYSRPPKNGYSYPKPTIGYLPPLKNTYLPPKTTTIPTTTMPAESEEDIQPGGYTTTMMPGEDETDIQPGGFTTTMAPTTTTIATTTTTTTTTTTPSPTYGPPVYLPPVLSRKDEWIGSLGVTKSTATQTTVKPQTQVNETEEEILPGGFTPTPEQDLQLLPPIVNPQAPSGGYPSGGYPQSPPPTYNYGYPPDPHNYKLVEYGPTVSNYWREDKQSYYTDEPDEYEYEDDDEYYDDSDETEHDIQPSGHYGNGQDIYGYNKRSLRKWRSKGWGWRGRTKNRRKRVYRQSRRKYRRNDYNLQKLETSDNRAETESKKASSEYEKSEESHSEENDRLTEYDNDREPEEDNEEYDNTVNQRLKNKPKPTQNANEFDDSDMYEEYTDTIQPPENDDNNRQHKFIRTGKYRGRRKNKVRTANTNKLDYEELSDQKLDDDERYDYERGQRFSRNQDGNNRSPNEDDDQYRQRLEISCDNYYKPDDTHAELPRNQVTQNLNNYDPEEPDRTNKQYSNENEAHTYFKDRESPKYRKSHFGPHPGSIEYSKPYQQIPGSHDTGNEWTPIHKPSSPYNLKVGHKPSRNYNSNSKQFGTGYNNHHQIPAYSNRGIEPQTKIQQSSEFGRENQNIGNDYNPRVTERSKPSIQKDKENYLHAIFDENLANVPYNEEIQSPFLLSLQRDPIITAPVPVYTVYGHYGVAL